MGISRKAMRVMTAIVCASAIACTFAAPGVRKNVTRLISAAWSVKPITPVREILVGAGYELNIAGKQATLAKVSPADLAGRLAWATVQQSDGWLVFHGETLKQAVDAFNRYNDRQLIVLDEKTAQLQVGGKFRTGDIDGFVAALELTHGVRAVRASPAGAMREVIALTGQPDKMQKGR
jgi:ferric-dicitrate binding protein FerR (iron transport regulator)